MKTIITVFILAFSFFAVNAQQIWTEGTSWEIHMNYTDNSSTEEPKVYFYELGEPVSFNDTIYYTLTETNNGVTNIVSYLRAEADDSYVYARHFQSEQLGVDTGESSEMLLYDFSKPFALGDTLRVGTVGGNTICEYIDPDYPDHLTYYYDIIEPGDCLPAYGDIIYKVGSCYGPIYYITFREQASTDSTPDPKNVSHVLFKTKGKPNGSMITLRIDIVSKECLPLHYYSLTGMRYENAHGQILFRKGSAIICR